MNEQLVVKNFGPIKDATVDFKRVTVFIGPTGGGKSTLAKLAAVFRDKDFMLDDVSKRKDLLRAYALDNYAKHSTSFQWKDENGELLFDNDFSFDAKSKRTRSFEKFLGAAKDGAPTAKEFLEKLSEYVRVTKSIEKPLSSEDVQELAVSLMETLVSKTSSSSPQYVPSDRAFITSISSSFAGLMRDDIGIAKPLLSFANAYFQARDDVYSLDIPFLDVEYFRHDSKDYISFADDDKQASLLLNETASGIQSVTPLLVLLEHLSRNTEQAQSFIIEEPELNLYPTAQQGLLNWLVEKCTKGENDLTITTHSPYILSHLNLLLYAYQVAEQHPDRRTEVAAIVPEASWINPKEFACYQVENGGVQSLVNDNLGLIDTNELDALSGDAADAFDNLIRLSKGIAVK